MSVLLNALRSALASLRGRATGRRGAGGQAGHASDAALLAQRFPQLEELRRLFEVSKKLLLEPYAEYVSTVSTPIWALSHQTAALCHALCCRLAPAKVLDLGTGFSSYVLRTYARAADRPCSVYSVDDNQDWLDKTREFLRGKDLSLENLYLWRDYRRMTNQKFDLIVHDLGGKLKVRVEALNEILGHCAPSGIVVLDDLHKWDYEQIALTACDAQGFRLIYMDAETTDQFGRFAGLALPN